MDASKDFKSMQDEIQAALITTIRTEGQISSEDVGFQRSLNPEVGKAIDEQSARLLALSTALLKSAATLSGGNVPVLEETGDVDQNWRGVVDVVDTLLEKTDICLDEYTGVIKRRDSEQAGPSVKPQKRYTLRGNALRTQNLVKPQLAFENKPNNDDTSPWRPLLATKPHATVPLKDSLGTITNDFEQKQFRHPYETEILQLNYPDAVYQKADPIHYLPIETTSAIFVDIFEGVLEMLTELKNATEIAVDLEHHDARSYVGLVSLMQISTRHKDWIVDTLRPWRHRLEVLNEVFADPRILKVFHGAFMDIVWLQRDLGLYVVGLFDTHWASKELGYAAGSLAFLLKRFIDFDADKKYQMADWRIRPLPYEMFYYARADTHFLLHIYDNMRNELIDQTNIEVPEENKIESVLQQSKKTSLLRYERQNYDPQTGKGPGGWYNALSKTPALFNNEQFAVFRAVHTWRDRIARTDDDSPNFVMPNHVVVNIAKLLPTDLMALHGVIHPVSYGVKSRTGELYGVIKTARSNGKNGPSMMDVLRPNSVGAVAKASISSVSTAPPNVPVLDLDESQLRSDKSAFWGGAFGSSIWDPVPTTQPGDSLRLAVPLPPLSSDLFGKPTGLTYQAHLANLDMPLRSLKNGGDEVFTIKTGTKESGGSSPDSEGSNAKYDMTFDTETTFLSTQTPKFLRQKARKEQAKERKKAERAREREVVSAAQAQKPESEESKAEQEPFDYSNAASVLHGKRKGEHQGGRENKKPFNPFGMNADGPQGMRRLKNETPGKSFTFKS